jgi:hypothetical protein
MAFKVPGGISKLGFAGNRYCAGLGRVFVLPVAAASSRQAPAIVLKKSDQLPDFHILLVSVPVRVTSNSTELHITTSQHISQHIAAPQL